MRRSGSLLLPVLWAASACSDPLAPAGLRHYEAIAVGAHHSCAVAEGGLLYCWGLNADGQLGDGGTTAASTPRPVQSQVRFRSVTAGDAHTCGLATDGRAYCWGWNAFFQTGVTAQVDLKVPRPVDTPERFVSLSAGAHHTCGVAEDGRVLCWGYNRWGQTGSGHTQTTIPAEPIRGDLRAVEVTAGGHHTCALSEAGEAYCWGQNDYGQLGVAADLLYSTQPVPVNASLIFTKLDAGATHSCGIAAGTAYCWGSSIFGEIGDGAPFKPGLPGPASPTPVLLLTAVTEIAAGDGMSCAVAQGRTACWGHGTDGQLGNGNTVNHPVRQPVFLTPNEPFALSPLAAGGATHACGLNQGLAYCWGSGPYGQLGAGVNSFSVLPQRVRE